MKPYSKQFNTLVGGKPIVFETGRLAGLAGGAVTVRLGETMMCAAATISAEVRPGIVVFPLTVDYEERMYAGGRIPGSFFRREGRPPQSAILIARLPDRPLRPLFPKDMRNDVQVILYSISSDGEPPIDVLAILGASTALSISDIPFDGPVGALRVGMDDQGGFIFNPSYQEVDSTRLDLRMAGTRDAVLRVECNATELDESTLLAALEAGHKAMQPLLEVQDQMRQDVGKPKRANTSIALREEVKQAVASWLGDRAEQLLAQPHGKAEFNLAMDELESELFTALGESEEFSVKELREGLWAKGKQGLRGRVIHDSVRADGRSPSDIRPIEVAVDLSPRAHGSGMFRRGASP